MKKMNRRKAMRVILGAMAMGATAATARVNPYNSCAANMTDEDKKPKGKCGSKMDDAECKKYREEMKGKCGTGKCGGSMR